MSSLPDPDRLRLRDIAVSIESIQRYVADHPESITTARGQVWEAILWNLAVIGEAAKAISPETKAQVPDAAWDEAARLRDFVVHHYAAVDPFVISNTIKNDLPKLLKAVVGLLDRGPGN